MTDTNSVLVSRAFLSQLRDVHQDAADALVDSHGDVHREIVDKLRAILEATPEGGLRPDPLYVGDEMDAMAKEIDDNRDY